jgi:hypothetical protein
MKIITNIILFLSLAASTSFADTIYKSIDKNGRVTYSTTPPTNSEKSKSVDIAAPPSEERIKAAQERQERNKEAAGIMDENRKKRDEITAEENRLKREKQKQLQQQQQAEKNNENDGYGYPYIPGRRPGGIRPGPIQLPAR